MLPYPHNLPAFRGEGTGNETVASTVGGQLSAPKLAVVGRLPGTPWARMPETAVDEDSDTGARKGEVGPPREGEMAAPAGYAVGAQEREHGKLGVAVSTGSDPAHHP